MTIKLNVQKKEYKAFLEALQFYTHVNVVGEKEDKGHYFIIELEYTETDNLYYFGFHHGQIYEQIKDV